MDENRVSSTRRSTGAGAAAWQDGQGQLCSIILGRYMVPTGCQSRLMFDGFGIYGVMDTMQLCRVFQIWATAVGRCKVRNLEGPGQGIKTDSAHVPALFPVLSESLPCRARIYVGAATVTEAWPGAEQRPCRIKVRRPVGPCLRHLTPPVGLLGEKQWIKGTRPRRSCRHTSHNSCSAALA